MIAFFTLCKNILIKNICRNNYEKDVPLRESKLHSTVSDVDPKMEVDWNESDNMKTEDEGRNEWMGITFRYALHKHKILMSASKMRKVFCCLPRP